VKKFLAIFISAVWIVACPLSGIAERWTFPGMEETITGAPVVDDEPFASVLAISADGTLEAFSGIGVAPFVPIEFDQFVISLVDLETDDSILNPDNRSLIPRIQLNSGIKTESYLLPPQSLQTDEFFSGETGEFDIKSSVIFIGVGLDFDAIHLKGKAFVGRPLETFSDKLHGAGNSEFVENGGVDTTALGFEASAGYQLSNMIMLGAGFGKLTDKNKETDQSEEVYAVYAQAILAIAPGVQVKPEVGQVERIKEELENEETDQSFYAGAIWEINF
jgi:hypothetical protein